MACPSASHCVAVGFSQHLSGVLQSLIVTGSRARWRPVSVPLPAGADRAMDAQLLSLACPSARLCVAAGYYTDSSGGQHGLLVTISGSTVRPVKAKLPHGGKQAQLFSVACPSASRCVAGGTFYDGNGYSHALLLTSSGWPAAPKNWTAVTPPLPPDAGGVPDPYIFAVACHTASWCVAPASYWDSAGDTRIAWITSSGTSWHAAEVHDPADIQPGSANGDECMQSFLYCLGNSGPYLFSVSCVGVAKCAASGSYTNTAGHDEGIMVRQSGPASAPAATALPLGAKAGAVNGLGPVACSPGLNCVAAGAYQDPASQGVPVLATSSGASWRLVRPPLPGVGAASGAPLNSIACASAARCVAVGGYLDRAGRQAYLTVGARSSWSSGPLPYRVPVGGNALDAVTCAPRGTCTAAGASGNRLLLATGPA